MRTFMRTTFLVSLLLVGISAFAAQVSIGIRIGPPPPPRVVAVPVTPGPEFVWVEGYWYPLGNHYKWHPGYWTRPPYSSARWVPPHHDGERYFDGYWEGDHGRFKHNHHWDRDRDRDFDRDRDGDRDRDRR
jgi:hypothetical protein